MNPEDRKVMEMARDALKPVSMLLQGHNSHGDGGRPIFGINDALLTLGNLRNVVTALAAIEERLQAKSKAEELAERGFVKPPYPTAADDFGGRLRADEKEGPKPGDVIGHAKLVYTGRMPPRKFDVEEDEKEEPATRVAALESFYAGVSGCMGDTWQCERCGNAEPWWENTNADYATKDAVAALRSREEG